MIYICLSRKAFGHRCALLEGRGTIDNGRGGTPEVVLVAFVGTSMARRLEGWALIDLPQHVLKCSICVVGLYSALQIMVE